MAQPVWALDTLNNAADQEFLRQQQQGRALREQLEKQEDIHLQAPINEQADLILAETPCFVIENIKLVGTGAKLANSALKQTLKNPDSVVNRCLGVKGINLVINRLQNNLIAQGYITTRAYVGQQDLTQGTLTITIIKGEVNNVYLTNESSYTALWNSVSNLKQQPLNLRDLEQALENLKRVPTADAEISLIPSPEQQGLSDLEINYKQIFPLRFSISLDDSGSKATGKYQGNLSVSYDNPLKLSDLFYVSLSHDLGGGDTGSRGNKAQMMHYSIPYNSWLFALTGSKSDYYQSIPGLTETYIYSGENEQIEFKATHMLWRNSNSKLLVSAQVQHRRSWNYIDNTEIEVQRRISSGWAGGLNYRTNIQNLTLDSHLTYKRGTGAFGALRAAEEVYDEGTSRYQLINLDNHLSLPFTFKDLNLRYNARVNLQYELTPLLPQERFSIGGRYSVRGFDGESSLMGERGYLISNTLGWILNGTYKEIYFGLDAGQVFGPSTVYLQDKALVGTTLGVRGFWHGFSYDIFYGLAVHQPQNFNSKNTAGFALNYSF